MGDCHVRDVSLSRGGVDPSLRGEWKRAAATDIARDCLTRLWMFQRKRGQQQVTIRLVKMGTLTNLLVIQCLEKAEAHLEVRFFSSCEI